MTPSVLEQRFMPVTKSLRSGTCASTLLPRSRSAHRALGIASSRAVLAKEPHGVGMPFSTGGLCDVGRRLDAEARETLALEMLQQIAVVAGDLHDLGVSPQLEALIICSA